MAPAGDKPPPYRSTEPSIMNSSGGRSSLSMGQERFADIVERFANGDKDPSAGVSPDTVRRWQEEMERQTRRAQNLSAMVLNPTEPKVGCTPREEIYRTNKSRLYRYASKRTH